MKLLCGLVSCAAADWRWNSWAAQRWWATLAHGDHAQLLNLIVPHATPR